MKKLNKILVSLFLCLILISFNINKINIIETKQNEDILAINLNEKSNTRYLKNLAVFIKFNNSDTNVIHHLDDEQSVENAYKIFNSEELFEMDSVNGIIKVPSFKKYYERESYGELSITTEIFPKVDGKVVSYTDPNPIGYYLSFNEQNQIGYKDKTESLQRETELVNNAVKYIKEEIESSGITSSELDTDNNGIIDAISFIVEGQKNLPSNRNWNDLLWSHKLDNTGVTETILGKKITGYNLIYAEDYTESASLFSLNRGTYGTLIHEFGHTLGYADLYTYRDSYSKPVGFYDIMGITIGSNPQSFLTYYISEYRPSTNWHNPLPVINKTTSNITLYKPQFIDKNEQRAVKVQIDGNNDEYFIIEYHDKLNTYETYSADSNGIIIYRINERKKYFGNTDGSDQGKNNHVYIFRPNETDLGAGRGDLREATLNMKRKTFGKKLDLNNKEFDNETIHFSDGTNSGIIVEVISETEDSVTFNITFPELEGEGTKNNPYLINDVNTFIYLMSLNTKNKYYKLTSDLDFSSIGDYPIINFEGNLDGNNKTIRNIKTNGSGVFNNVGNYNTHTKIENLNIENIVVYSNKENYLGGFTGAAENITLNNIHLRNGSVTKEGNSLNAIVSVGGFAGNVSNNVIINNCSTDLDVTATKNIGGFIGLNQNAIIKNSFSSGTLNGNSNVGGFIGLQAINDNTYNIPENVYYNATENTNLQGVGGYASGFHNLNILNIESLSKGIISITTPKTLTILENFKTNLSVTTSPNTNLSYTVTVEDIETAKYENNKIVALKQGTTKIFININIGNSTMVLTTNLTVKEFNGFLTEEDILSYLGLTKRENYVIGFALNTNVSDIKENISNINGVTLTSFTNEKDTPINKGLISTGMKFSLYFNNTEFNYTVVVKGDINGDGLIYATDYVKVKNHIMGKTKLTGPYLIAADINNDGKIYATDYVQIKNHIMGKLEITQY